MGLLVTQHLALWTKMMGALTIISIKQASISIKLSLMFQDKFVICIYNFILGSSEIRVHFLIEFICRTGMAVSECHNFLWVSPYCNSFCYHFLTDIYNLRKCFDIEKQQKQPFGKLLSKKFLALEYYIIPCFLLRLEELRIESSFEHDLCLRI